MDFARKRRQFSAPVLRAVPDVQDFDNFFGVPVHNDVRRADEFAGSLHLSGSAKAGEGRQLFDAVDNCLRDSPRSGWIVLLDVCNSGFKLVASVVHLISLTSETACRYGSAPLDAPQTRHGRLARCLFALLR